MMVRKEKPKKQIGQILKEFREEYELTQEGLRDYFEYNTQSAVSQIEAGLRRPTRKRLSVLEAKFDLPQGYFTFLEEFSDNDSELLILMARRQRDPKFPHMEAIRKLLMYKDE